MEDASFLALETGAHSTARKTSGELAGNGSGGREATKSLAEERPSLSLDSRMSATKLELVAFLAGVVVALGGADCFGKWERERENAREREVQRKRERKRRAEGGKQRFFFSTAKKKKLSLSRFRAQGNFRLASVMQRGSPTAIKNRHALRARTQAEAQAATGASL